MLESQFVSFVVARQRSLQVHAVTFNLPSAIVNGSAEAKRFLAGRDFTGFGPVLFSQLERVDLVQNFQRALETIRCLEIRVLIRAQRVALSDFNGTL